MTTDQIVECLNGADERGTKALEQVGLGDLIRDIGFAVRGADNPTLEVWDQLKSATLYLEKKMLQTRNR